MIEKEEYSTGFVKMEKQPWQEGWSEGVRESSL